MTQYKPMTFFLPPETIAGLRAVAKANGRTIVAEARRALARHIAVDGRIDSYKVELDQSRAGQPAA